MLKDFFTLLKEDPAAFMVTYWNFFIWAIVLALLLALFDIFKQAWLFYKRLLFKEAIKWTLLEIRIPREVTKTPRAMEQFFVAIHGLRNAAGDFLEKYIDGEVTLWWSLEMVSFGGEIHFYIRTPENRRKMIEAAFYAQYSNVELIEIEDYLEQIPKETKGIYQNGENIFGGEFILRKEDVYPITTYEKFEADKETMALDPISALLEALAHIHKEEKVFLQILIRPAGSGWQEEAKKFIDKLVGREEKKPAKSGFGAALAEFFRNLFFAPAEYPIWSGEAQKKEEIKADLLFKMTPGERELVKTLEENIAKPGFETLIRYLYLAPQAIFSTNFARRGLLGGINQYASPLMNSFRGNSLVETRTRWIYFPYFFVKQRVEARKQRILHNYRNREMPEELPFGKFYTSHPYNFNTVSKTYILTTAELATIYHLPTETVLVAPHVKRAEAKKMGPPAGLPIFKEE